MKKSTVKEILTDPKYRPIQFRIDIDEIPNFVNSPKDAKALQFAAGIYLEKDKYSESGKEKAEGPLVVRDVGMAVNNALIDKANKVDVDKLMAFLGARVIQTFADVAGNSPTKYEKYDYCYSNGDIIIRDNKDNWVRRTLVGEKEKCTATSFDQEIKQLAEAGFLIYEYFSQNKAHNVDETQIFLAQSGKYGQQGTGIISSNSVKDLNLLLALTYLNHEDIINYIRSGKLSKSGILSTLRKMRDTKDMALRLYAYGILTKEEVERTYGSPMNKLLCDDSITKNYKILLYINGKINIRELQECINLDEQDNMIYVNSEDIKPLKGQFGKIAELIMHKVMQNYEVVYFLRRLEEDQIITAEERAELEELRDKYIADEIINDSSLEEVNIYSSGKQLGQSYRQTTAIDPELRRKYLESIGSKKVLKVKATRGEGKSLALEGYSFFVIPEKRVVVLDKLYDTYLDRDGNVNIRRDKNEAPIPAVENATYILPVGLARDLVKTRSKQDLIKNKKDVRRVHHTANWVNSLEEKIREINPKAQFEEKDTRKWAQAIRDNYNVNREKMRENLKNDSLSGEDASDSMNH